MVQDLAFYLNKFATPAEIHQGGSGYFSTPLPGLDPHIFNGDRIRPEVRAYILNTLYTFWRGKYANAQDWSRVWIAGSGASYQWAADRGNGDLDVLIGISMNGFEMANPGYGGLTQAELSGLINGELKSVVWPRTAHTALNGQTYEVTFYWNPGVGDDTGSILAIHPYAAYDITASTWTVRPPQLPADPHSLYPAEFRQAIESDKATAARIIDRFNTLIGQASSPSRDTALQLITSQARSMFQDIHLGRKQAFGDGGNGYGDYHNYRWQSHKEAGTVQALAAIASADLHAHQAQDSTLYGRPIQSAHDALVTAALYRRNR